MQKYASENIVREMAAIYPGRDGLMKVSQDNTVADIKPRYVLFNRYTRFWHSWKADISMEIGDSHNCPASRTTLVATRFWVVMICPIIKCLTVLEFSFILFDLCLFITIFNFILNYVPIVTFWIFTYHKIWILLIIFCFIWSYWIIYFSTSLEVFWSVVS